MVCPNLMIHEIYGWRRVDYLGYCNIHWYTPKTKIMKLYLSTILISISLCIHGQMHDWERTNPGGGGAYSTIGAGISGIIIAGSDLSGAYRSRDNGQSWDVIGSNHGMTETHVSGIGFHRLYGDILFVGTENGIFGSDDGGDNMVHVLEGGYITDIEFGTDTPNIGYASYHPEYNSNEGVVYRSNNNGNSWSKISNNLPSGLRILKIVVNPKNADIVYVLTGQGRFACGPANVYRSTDGGINWEDLTSSISEILDFAIDPNQPDNVYITTMNTNCSEEFYWTDLEGSIYKSTNGGSSWGNPLSDYTGVIWIDTNNASTIRLIDTREPFPWIDRSGTWTSTNGGSSFSKTGDVEDWDTFFNEDVFFSYSASYNGITKTLGSDLSNPNNLLWVNYQWVFRTTDNGTTFENIFTDEVSTGFWRSRGFDNVNMMDVVISEVDADIIYTAYFDIGLWRSLNRGETWQSCNPEDFSGNWEGKGGNCATVIADPSRANVVWASMSENQNGQTPTYLLKNTNTGKKEDWILSNSGLPEIEIMGLSIDKLSDINNRTLYVTGDGDVYKSTDDGTSWTMVHNCNGCRYTAVDQFDGQNVYAGGEQGLWWSSDGGSTWTDVSHSDMKASSGIEFWDRDYDGVFDIKTDPNNSDIVFVTALGSGKGLYRSSNSKTFWDKILSDDYMRRVAIVPQNSNIIYATSSSAFETGGFDPTSSGILFSKDGGQSWTPQNEGMAYALGMAVAVDNTSTPTVFVGSPGTGFQKSLVDEDALDVTSLSIEDSFITIAPNPTTGFISIDSEYPVVLIEVYSRVGKKIKVILNPSELTVNLEEFNSGIYYIRVSSEKYTSIEKVVLSTK